MSDLPALAARLRALGPGELRSVAGPTTVSRGLAYAAQRRVGKLAISGPWSVRGTVRGTGRTYSTEVELYLSRGRLTWTGTCSCPVGVDCKHCVALLMTARDSLGLAGVAAPAVDLVGAPTGPPAWERALREVIIEEPAPLAPTPVALLVELERPGHGYYGAPTLHGDMTVQLRPMTPGKRGWIKTGLTWNNLDVLPRHGPIQPDPQALAALRALAAPAWQQWMTRADRLSLSLLGPGWAGRLRDCRAAGVRLITDPNHTGELTLVEEPARVVLDLRAGADGAIVLTPELLAPDAFDEHDPVLVGHPPLAVAARRGADLWLAPVDPPIDPATLRLLQGGAVTVPAGDVDRFRTGHLTRLSRRFEVHSPDGSVAIPAIGRVRLALDVTHLPGLKVGVRWRWRYPIGSQTVDIDLDSREQPVPRDPAAERALLGTLEVLDRVAGLREREPTGDWRVLPRVELAGAEMLRLLNQVLPELAERDDIDVHVHGDPVPYTEATDDPIVRVALRDSADTTDWFDLDITVEVGGQPVPLRELLRALTRDEELLILPSGTWFRTDRPELHELRRLVEEARAMQEDPRAPLRLSAYQADLWAELEELGVVETQSRRWRSLVQGLAALDDTARVPVAAPDGLAATLRPYQHAGFEWLTFLLRAGLGGILADDMGLGKTMQALATILQARADADAGAEEGAAAYPPFLVVAPTSVLATWVAEAATFAPGLRVVTLGSTSGKRGSSVLEATEGADLVVTSYAVFRLDADSFRERSWAGLLLDEAQFVKNHQSQAYSCARALDAPSKFAITGTPMENNLMELWALLSIVAPGLFPRPTAFQEHFRRPIESGEAPERLDTLRRRIRPVMLRRTKEAVATELPPKIEQVIEVALAPRHRRVYDRIRTRERQRVLGLLDDADRNRIAILRSLTLLRQASLDAGLVDADAVGWGSAKVDTLVEMLTPVLAEGHQALVFSQFTGYLATVRDRLDAEGIGYAYLDGRTRKRQEAIETFRSGARRVFLVSLKAGGFGLTLTEADYVFLLDPWWNPAVEAQAIDRTHRIGQDKHVNVYRLVAADTIEQKVLALQARKRELFAQVVDEGALASGALTAEDIRGLL